MKVMMLVARSTGGIGTHVAELSANLRAQGADVVVVTDPLTAGRFDFGEVRLWWPGAAVTFHGLRDLLSLRRLARSSDIVHAHGHQAGLLATVVTLAPTPRRSRHDGPKLVVSQHNAVLRASGLQGLKHVAQRWVARRADLLTGASQDLVDVARAMGARRAELAQVPSPRVPGLLAQPPADSPTRSQIRQKLLAPFSEDRSLPLVLTISRIAPQKNLAVLVEAASTLSGRCTWVVLGDGDPVLLADLQARALALDAPVHFIGARADIEQWLRAADVFVLPSEWEARALVVQEAMAAGTPVVATDVGGLHDLVLGTGLLVTPGDPEAIANATDRVLGDEGLRADLSARGREVATALPDGRDTASRWLVRYAQTLAMT